MSTPKGFGSQKKMSVQEGQHVTVEPVAGGQYGLTVRSHATFRLVGNDTTENDSTAAIIEATGHAAKVGDLIRVTSGGDADFETSVWKIEANLIYLTDDFPGGAPGAGVTFQILRSAAQVISTAGSSTLVAFERDNVSTVVEEDTVTPANNRPLPAKLMDGDGAEILGQQDSAAASSDTGTFSIIALIKRGLERWTTFLGRYPAALGQTTMSASIPVAIASDQSGVAVTGPLTDTQLRATAVPVTGPLTDTQLRATAVPVSGPLTDTQLRATAVPVSGPLTDTQLRATAVPISAAALPLPTGATTLTEQQTQSTRLGGLTETAPGSDTASSGLNGRLQRIAQRITSLIALFPATLGQKTMANSFAVTLASDQTAIPDARNANATDAQSTTLGSGSAATESAPSDAIGFVLMADADNSVNIRFRQGGTATTSSGMRLQPGRDTGFIPCAGNLSLIAESGSNQGYQLLWIRR